MRFDEVAGSIAGLIMAGLGDLAITILWDCGLNTFWTGLGGLDGQFWHRWSHCCTHGFCKHLQSLRSETFSGLGPAVKWTPELGPRVKV
jgi:hypothetical protein